MPPEILSIETREESRAAQQAYDAWLDSLGGDGAVIDAGTERSALRFGWLAGREWGRLERCSHSPVCSSGGACLDLERGG